MRLYSRILVGLGLVIVGVGCSSAPPSRHQFNDRLTISNRKLAIKGTAFNKAGNDFLQKGDPSGMQSAASACRSTLDEIQAEYDEAQLPKNSASAEGLLEEYKKYLKAQSVIVKLMQEAATVANDTKIGGKERLDRVEILMKDMQRTETKAWEALEKKYREFTEEHFFKPVKEYRE